MKSGTMIAAVGRSCPISTNACSSGLALKSKRAKP